MIHIMTTAMGYEWRSGRASPCLVMRCECGFLSTYHGEYNMDELLADAQTHMAEQRPTAREVWAPLLAQRQAAEWTGDLS